MKTRSFRMVIVKVMLGLALLVGPSASAHEEVQFVFHKISFQYQIVEVRKADGGVARGDFAAEMILLPDGRANGGFGIWEHGSTAAPLLYRVVAGEASINDRQRPFDWKFYAKRINGSADEITINISPAPGSLPAGSVTFFVDGVNAADGTPLSFQAEGNTHRESARDLTQVDALFSFVYVNAPPQTVEVATLTDLYISTFQNVGLLFPNAGAIGSLELTTPSGEPVRYHYGPGVYKTSDSGKTWVLHAISNYAKLRPSGEAIIIVRPDSDASEPCRIYDIAGTQVHTTLGSGVAHFEAETLVTRFTIAEP